MRTLLSLIIIVTGITGMAFAQVQTEVIEYDQGGVTLEGTLVWDGAVDGPRPGVLVVHQWMGPGAHELQSATRLAELGYAAFIADIYGQGVRPADSAEAAAQAGKYRADRALMRERAAAGLQVLKAQSVVDPARTAAIGYCFGGGVVLELARSGAGVNAVVSFHGNLDTPDPAAAADITAEVLVLHGADDPHVPAEQVAAFMDEMRNAGVSWEFVAYGNAVHAFTDERLGTDNSTGAAYNAKAAARSWQAMANLFAEVFGE